MYDFEKTNESVTEKIEEYIKANNIPLISEKNITKLKPHIGEGTFGKVYKGIYNELHVAIKKIKFEDITDAESIIQEIKGVGKIQHERIPKFHGVWKTDTKLHLIFDFIDGDILTSFIPALTNDDKIIIGIELVDIIEKLHDENLIHRDLKPSNIMLMKGKVYLIDFGVSKIANHTSTGTKHQLGTIPYMAPENYLVDTNKKLGNVISISTKFDVWSLGCILSYLFSKIPPWGEKATDISVIKKLAAGKTFPIPDMLPQELKEILKLCFDIKPESRISAKELKIKLIENKDVIGK